MAVMSLFGWSALWALPLSWRLVKVFLLKRSTLFGQGFIRLVLGTIFMLCAGSALVAFVRGPDSSLVGVWLAAVLGAATGKFLGFVLALAIALLSAPWLFGHRALDFLSWCYRAVSRSRKLETKDRPAAPRPAPQPRVHGVPGGSGDRFAGRRPTRRQAAATPPAAFPAADAVAKTAPNPPSTKARTEAPARPSEQWAEVESLRPTTAMLARARAVDEASTRHEQRKATRIIKLPHAVAPPPATGSMPLPAQAMPAPQAEPAAVAMQVIRAEVEIHTIRTAEPVLVAAPIAWQPAPVSDIPHFHGHLPVFVESAIKADEPTYVEWQEVAPVSAPEPVREAAVQPAVQSSAAQRPDPIHRETESDVQIPGLDLLDAYSEQAIDVSSDELAETGRLIEQRLKEFKVPVNVLGASAGPVITRFEIEPAIGVRGAQIVALVRDLSRALAVTSVRVVETIPGKTCMGLELPNVRRQMIQLSEILDSDAYRASRSQLTLAMGKDITGAPVVTDLARAPHMLVAGTTGSGKSVAINAMIVSLLYKATPEDVRMIMIDPKMLELSVYDGIPHLLAPVVTDMKLAANALTWCVAEMEKRYRLMSALGVRNLAGFNQKIRDGKAAEKYISNPFSLTPDAPEPLSTLPTIVVIIDELADLMMVAGKKIEELIARLAQKARAAGIHLILATQRPSVDVITGLIKANIPTRVAFQVSSKIDSRTVLDQMGAETLLGHGDMLFLPPGSGYPQRVHGAFVSDEEVHRVVDYLKQFGEPEYEEAILAGAPSEEPAADLLGDVKTGETDPLYDEAVAYVIRSRRASISSIQRQLRIGYNRSARLVEEMETAGIVSSMSTNGSREVLVPPSAD